MPAFYGKRWFIALFTRDRHLTLSWARSIQSMSPHPTSWRVIIVLSSHPHLGLPNGLFLRFPHPTPVCTSLCLPYVPLALPILWCLIWSSEYLVRSTGHKAFRYVAPLPVTSFLLGPNQHPILEHPQPLFLLQCRSLSSVYNSAHLKFCMFG